MNPVEIRPRRPEDDTRIVEIENRDTALFPPNTVEEFRAKIEVQPAGQFAEHWVAGNDQDIVGVGELFAPVQERIEAVYGFVTVDPEWRRQGVGGLLARQLTVRSERAGAMRLYTYVFEGREESLAFLQRRGFALTGKGERLSRLDTTEARLDGFEGEEERLQTAGLRIACLAELDLEDREWMRTLYEMDNASHHDIPGSEPFHPRPFDDWRQITLHGPGRSPQWTWVARDGHRPVGLARLRRRGPEAAWNAYTGVDREYRGRGIARALKLRTIRWARENGVRWIYTGNEAANLRMLDINVRLGYQFLPRELEMLKSLDTATTEPSA